MYLGRFESAWNTELESMSREKEGDRESSKMGYIIREGFSVLGGGFLFLFLW